MTEERLHITICKYIQWNYPKVIFNSDASGLRLPMGMAVKFKKMHSFHKQLDITIFRASKGYHALILEVKKDRSQVYLKDNKTFRKSKHVESQNKTIEVYRNEGYKAEYVFSLDDAIREIDKYLKK